MKDIWHWWGCSLLHCDIYIYIYIYIYMGGGDNVRVWYMYIYDMFEMKRNDSDLFLCSHHAFESFVTVIHHILFPWRINTLC
jgi:hypothetical protein